MAFTYREAGVDVDAGNRAVALIKKHVHSTFGPQVLGDLGFFCGLYRLEGCRDPVLVASTDGVGTKLRIAFALNRHDTVGIDLVNHCVNDILTCGAQPLFFLDYLAMGKLVPEVVEQIVSGMAVACREVGCALLGGETAEMPDFYVPGEYDLAGTIIGVAERDRILDGHTIEAGDVLIGLASSGLHTNGYTLVRKLFGVAGRGQGAAGLDHFQPELGCTLGEELLKPHRCYYPALRPVLPLIKGMAHITGGGLIDNLPRVLPEGLGAHVTLGTWEVPAVFRLIQERGSIEQQEMFRTFNMGLGMVLITSQAESLQVMRTLGEGRIVGYVTTKWHAQRVVVK